MVRDELGPYPLPAQTEPRIKHIEKEDTETWLASQASYEMKILKRKSLSSHIEELETSQHYSEKTI